MEILPFVPDWSDPKRLTQYAELRIASLRVDHPREPRPSRDALIGFLFTPLPHSGTCEHWVACRDGRLVGVLSVGSHADDNRHVGVAEVAVHPDFRDHGVETELLRAALPALRGRGQTVVTFAGVTDGSSVDRWLRGLGFVLVQGEVLQHLDLIRTDPGRWEVPASAGYHLRSWLGSAPADLIESYAAVRAAMRDQPEHDWSIRWPEWTPQQVREDEAHLRQQGVELMVTAMVDDATGGVVAINEVLLYPARPERAIQGNVAVLPMHRGRGLGLAVKAATMRWLRTERRHVIEAVASVLVDNSYMRRINERLGYTTRRNMLTFELGIDTLTDRLGA